MIAFATYMTTNTASRNIPLCSMNVACAGVSENSADGATGAASSAATSSGGGAVSRNLDTAGAVTWE